jgi:cell division septation protein DedD
LNDDLQPLKNRLRWFNRAILTLGVLILLGVIVWAVVALRKPTVGTVSTLVHPASAVSSASLARREPAPVAAASNPASTAAQQQKAAAAAIAALAAASAPASAPHAPASQSARASSAEPASAPPPAAASRPVAAAPATHAESARPAPTPVHRVQRHEAAVRHDQRVVRAAAGAGHVGTVAVCRAGGWYVQLGAFAKPQSVSRLAQRLHRAGYAEVCVAPRQVHGLHLFYVGPYRNAAAARAAVKRLHALTGAEGIVRRLR